MVQQFRTIISDAGANLGIIISQKRFQSGAHEEAKKTNVRLYFWLDFQKAFEERWTNTMTEKFRKLVCECSDLASELYDIDTSPEDYGMARERGMDLLRRCALLVKIASWEDTVVEKHESVRICETGPELRASQVDLWIELRTKREFYDYAIRVAEEQKRNYQEVLKILRAHLSR